MDSALPIAICIILAIGAVWAFIRLRREYREDDRIRRKTRALARLESSLKKLSEEMKDA